MSRRPIIVTDHAVLRYLERVQGLDIEGIRAHVADLVAPAMDAGASASLQGGWRYKLNPAARTVVTVMPLGRTPAPAGRPRAACAGREVAEWDPLSMDDEGAPLADCQGSKGADL